MYVYAYHEPTDSVKDTLYILLVEDDQDDIELFRYALKLNGIACHLSVLMTGDEVAPYLLTVPTLPDVIVLDLSLPKVNGRDVLRQIKASPGFKVIPMVVLTTSSAREDRDYCLALGVNQFLTKPTTATAFTATAATIVGLALMNKHG
ncbi:hypothetical protein GCM10027423_07950 [Spirosoma arcticum]